MSKEDYVNIILQYMSNTLEKYQDEISEIKERKFYRKFDDEDYYKMLVAQIKLECLTESFRFIREFLYFMEHGDK